MKSTSDWIELAELVWNSGKEARSGKDVQLLETEILDSMHDAELNSIASGDFQNALLLRALASDTGGQVTSTALYRWAEAGYPTVEMGEKFAASLLVSSVSDEVLNTIQIPWPGLCIIVPGDILQTYDPEKKAYIPVRRIFASIAKGRTHTPDENFGGDWQFVGMTSGTITLWRFGVTPKGMILDSRDMMPEGDSSGGIFQLGLEHTDVDARTAGLVGKLVVMTCVALTMKELVTTRQAHPVTKKAKKRDTKTGPSARIYTVGKPINLDFRDRVKNYTHGIRAAKGLNVQFMVAGHFKQQPYGEKHALRRTIWIEPYWKGDENAPVPIRPHTIE